MQEEDREEVMEMVVKFYNSPAVSHPVPVEVLVRTFKAAAAGNQGLQGYTLQEEGKIVGFAYITEYFACEVGGKNVMIEEIYLKEEARGKGYATEFFQWVFEKYSYAKRFRLEVSRDNPGVVKLYERLGFQFLDYGQMARDML